MKIKRYRLIYSDGSIGGWTKNKENLERLKKLFGYKAIIQEKIFNTDDLKIEYRS